MYVAPPIVSFLTQFPGLQMEAFRNLNVLFSGGAPVGPALVSKLMQKFEGFKFTFREGDFVRRSCLNKLIELFKIIIQVTVVRKPLRWRTLRHTSTAKLGPSDCPSLWRQLKLSMSALEKLWDPTRRASCAFWVRRSWKVISTIRKPPASRSIQPDGCTQETSRITMMTVTFSSSIDLKSSSKLKVYR